MMNEMYLVYNALLLHQLTSNNTYKRNKSTYIKCALLKII